MLKDQNGDLAINLFNDLVEEMTVLSQAEIEHDYHDVLPIEKLVHLDPAVIIQRHLVWDRLVNLTQQPFL